MSKGKKHALRQVAALPVRVSLTGNAEVLLITSRETGRWVIPKGWPMPPRPDYEAAAIEASEEAGAVGRIHCEPIGQFSYFKRHHKSFDLIDVTVYRLDVAELLADWRERYQRTSRWISPYQAAELVMEPGLAGLLRGDLAS